MCEQSALADIFYEEAKNWLKLRSMAIKKADNEKADETHRLFYIAKIILQKPLRVSPQLSLHFHQRFQACEIQLS